MKKRRKIMVVAISGKYFIFVKETGMRGKIKLGKKDRKVFFLKERKEKSESLIFRKKNENRFLLFLE